MKILAGTGEIQRTAMLRGDWGVPLVAYDGTPSGLSGDGEWLILIRPRTGFPRERTTFAYVDTDNMRVREQLTLEGDFSFDALSPDGSTMYLIEYLDPRDPTAYEVRAYDLDRGRLLPDPIIDPSEPDEEMFGFPQTRAVSPDGRWHYTLYETVGHDHPPFIHALDTENGSAVCIDLDALAEHRNVLRLSLLPSPDGTTLDVVDLGDPIASVDLETFDVSEPPGPDAAVASADDGSDLMPWVAIAGGGALLACALLLLWGRRRREGDSTDDRDQVEQLERLVAGEAENGDRERERDRVR